MTGLIADIGGTNARFALVEGDEIGEIETLETKNYPSLKDAIAFYLDGRAEVSSLAMGIPCTVTPVREDFSFANNAAWNFSRTQFKKDIGLNNLTIINDFFAIAYAVPHLTENDIVKVGDGSSDPDSVKSVIGPGTGLGAAVIAKHKGQSVPLASQGGHVTYPAITEREYEIVRYLQDGGLDQVSAEHLISGPGLVNIYTAISSLDRIEVPARTPSEIADAGLQKKCAVCEETLDHFCAMLGTIARNAAISPMSFGGMYIAGGIVPKLGDYFYTSRFRERFEGVGHMQDHLKRIPTYVITHPYPAFVGLKSLLEKS